MLPRRLFVCVTKITIGVTIATSYDKIEARVNKIQLSVCRYNILINLCTYFGIKLKCCINVWIISLLGWSVIASLAIIAQLLLEWSVTAMR